MGVAKDNFGSAGRPERDRGRPNAGIGLSKSSGITLGDVGIARPNRGARGLPAFCRLPGIGGRKSGAGEDMLYNGGGKFVGGLAAGCAYCQHGDYAPR